MVVDPRGGGGGGLVDVHAGYGGARGGGGGPPDGVVEEEDAGCAGDVRQEEVLDFGVVMCFYALVVGERGFFARWDGG